MDVGVYDELKIILHYAVMFPSTEQTFLFALYFMASKNFSPFHW